MAGLIDLLTQNLGVNETQASGGAGLIFNLAKSKLGGADFAQVSSAVPGIDSMMSSAQDTGGGLLGGIGKMASGLGGGAGGLGTLASLAGGFSKLGLDTGMVGKFVPIILSFVQSKGGDAVKGLLEKALK
jgi:hypothetical protein